MSDVSLGTADWKEVFREEQIASKIFSRPDGCYVDGVVGGGNKEHWEGFIWIKFGRKHRDGCGSNVFLSTLALGPPWGLCHLETFQVYQVDLSTTIELVPFTNANYRSNDSPIKKDLTEKLVLRSDSQDPGRLTRYIQFANEMAF